MSPHTPDPLTRKVEVDLSEILIRPESVERAAVTNDVEVPLAFLSAAKPPSISDYLPPISSSGWTNVIFALGASVIGLSYVVSIFEDGQNFRRSSPRLMNAAYTVAELSRATLPGFTQNQLSPVTTTPLTRSAPDWFKNAISSTRGPAFPDLTSPAFRPINENGSSPLMPTGDRIANSGLSSNSNSMHSTGSSSGRMSPARSSGGGESRKTSRQTQPEGLRIKNFTRHIRNSISRALRTVSNARNSGASKQQRSAGTLHTSTGRNAINHSMHSTGNSGATMQNRAGLNSMSMQHGMILQPTLGGNIGGLNGAGLGGGGNRGGGNVRR